MILSSWLDNMQINLYLTDIQTNEIIFMNNKMKETYNLKDPEGKICWKTLQKKSKRTMSILSTYQIKTN